MMMITSRKECASTGSAVVARSLPHAVLLLRSGHASASAVSMSLLCGNGALVAQYRYMRDTVCLCSSIIYT
jgi:hypothetical protein